MRWLIAVLFLAAAGYFIYQGAHPAPQEMPVPPAALANETAHAPMFTPDELAQIRLSAEDGEPAVRWAAIELLYNIRDPQAIALLEKTVKQDIEPSLKIKAISLLHNKNFDVSRAGLIQGLQDTDKSVRLASLNALGANGDPAAIPYITELLKDVEPDVRTQALRTLSGFQEKRAAQYAALVAQLRRNYDAALKSARARQQQE